MSAELSAERLNLPFTGIATFAKVPYHADLNTLDADVAIVGRPMTSARRSAPAPASAPAESATPRRSTGCAPSPTTTPSSTRSTWTASPSWTSATPT